MQRQRHNGKYGLSGREVGSLYENWRQEGLKGNSTWENFDEFIRWAAKNRYERYARLMRIDPGKPIGPDNAYWDYQRGESPTEYTDGHPCKDCDQEKGCATPCEIRLKYWDESMAKIRAVMGADRHG